MHLYSEVPRLHPDSQQDILTQNEEISSILRSLNDYSGRAV